jgi:hypothetical protein
MGFATCTTSNGPIHFGRSLQLISFSMLHVQKVLRTQGLPYPLLRRLSQHVSGLQTLSVSIEPQSNNCVQR